jgi:hypothetical protein
LFLGSRTNFGSAKSLIERRITMKFPSGPPRLFKLLLMAPLLLALILNTPVGQVAGAGATPVAKPPFKLAALQSGGDTDGDLEHIQMLIDLANSIRANLGPGGENMLSSGGLQFVTLGDREDDLKRALEAKKGSNPNEAEDFISRQAGSTQSETSVAWCDENAAIGFNDSGSFVATMVGPTPSPSFSFSFNGWSHSSDEGESFTDRGILVADPLPAGVRFRDLLGDPVLACSSESTFYYASLAMDTLFTGPPFLFSGISVSKSVDGGRNFGDTVMAVSKNAATHLLDKPWMTVAPGSSVIHVTYTDFDNTGSFCGFTPTIPPRPIPRTGIEYVRSVNGGVTFSAPTVIDQVCGAIPFLQGSHVATGLGTDVYVAYESYLTGQGGGATRQIRIAKSTDGGITFGAPVLVSSVAPVGTGFRVQGRFRGFFDFQGLVVDRSSKPTRGNVYISWQDGRNLNQVDSFSSPGCTAGLPRRYCFGDILLSRSTNGGASWSAPVRVNDDPITLKVDQLMPAAEVDRDGNLFVFFYDRRGDPRNFLIDAFVAVSRDAGVTWRNRRVTKKPFAAIIAEDAVVNPVYMGDYIGLAADATRRHRGIILAWGDNSLGDPNVLFAKLGGEDED